MIREELAPGVVIYCADCLDILPTLEPGSVDAVITDPPYGVGLVYERGFEDTTDFVISLLDRFVPEAERVSEIVIFPSGSYTIEKWLMANRPPRWRMCWYKGPQSTASAIGFSDFELMFVYGKNVYRRAHDYFSVKPETNNNTLHPCPKPVGWATWLIDRLSDAEETVADCFMGSGTTGVAAVKLGRKFIGIEKEPKYYDIAKRRILEALAQPYLLQVNDDT